MSSFAALGLAEPITRALAHEGYAAPTPIQSQTIPKVLADHDVLGIAQTGIVPVLYDRWVGEWR